MAYGSPAGKLGFGPAGAPQGEIVKGHFGGLQSDLHSAVPRAGEPASVDRRAGALLSYLICGLSVLLAAYHIWATPAVNWTFAVDPLPEADSDPPSFELILEYMPEGLRAHSAAVQISGDDIALMWFQGTREAHEDVVIKRVELTRDETGWSHTEPEVFLTTAALSAVSDPRQAVKILGTTIQYGRSPDALLATIVSVGGWAAASVAKVEMGPDGPVSMRKLPLSPVLNRSHLVRSPTLAYADGTLAVPAYFELVNAFGELVRLDADGRVRDKRRMTRGRIAIQPAIVPFNGQEAVALMRNFHDESDRLLASWTEDGGRTWSPPEWLDLPNPNAPVAALRLSTGEVLMAFNDSATDSSLLRLAVSADRGRTWRRIATLEDGGGKARYPAMERLEDGSILLSYSFGSKRGIRAYVFNEAWVAAQ